MRVAAVLLPSLLALAACADPGPSKFDGASGGWAPPPGYSGSVPSPEAQGRLRALDGKPVPVGVAGITQEGWTFGGFAVIPTDAVPGGKGPIVSFFKQGQRRDLHLPNDASVDRLIAEFERASAPR